MFTNIIVPVDLTPKNERAVQVARDLALKFDGRVTLFHVIETLDVPFEELRDFYDRLQEKAIVYMDGLARILETAAVPFEVHIQFGDRRRKILEFASERDADLLVMESHVVEAGVPGRGPTTMSYLVAVVADCPVLLVKGGLDEEAPR